MTAPIDSVINKIRQLNIHHDLASSLHYDFERRSVCLSLEQYITHEERYIPADITFIGVSCFESSRNDLGVCSIQELAAIDCHNEGDYYSAILTFSVGRRSNPWVVKLHFKELQFQR